MSDLRGTTEMEMLEFLLALATRAGGYERRGVRGWAHPADVALGASVHVGDALTQLWRRGLLIREDVRTPERQRPVYISRISEKGARLVVGSDAADSLIGLPEPAGGRAEPAVYMPPGAIVALRGLRSVLNDAGPTPHFPGELGWRSEAELWDLVFPEGVEIPEWVRNLLRGEPEEWEPWRQTPEITTLRQTWFGPLDLSWLVRAGYVQRFTTVPAGTRRPLVVYRATPAGTSAVPLEWHELKD